MEEKYRELQFRPLGKNFKVRTCNCQLTFNGKRDFCWRFFAGMELCRGVDYSAILLRNIHGNIIERRMRHKMFMAHNSVKNGKADYQRLTEINC